MKAVLAVQIVSSHYNIVRLLALQVRSTVTYHLQNVLLAKVPLWAAAVPDPVLAQSLMTQYPDPLKAGMSWFYHQTKANQNLQVQGAKL